jgi:hypothetical protein
MADTKKSDKAAEAEAEALETGTTDAVTSDAEILEIIEDDDRWSEGDVNALRDISAVNKVAGHAHSLAEWEASDAGKHFIEKVAPRREAIIEKQNEAAVAEAERVARAQEMLAEANKGLREQAEKDAKAAEKANKAARDKD